MKTNNQEEFKKTAKILKTDVGTYGLDFQKIIDELPNVTPKDGKNFSLNELQGFVNGLIEILPTTNPDLFLVCNEESKLEQDWKINKLATRLYKYSIPNIGVRGDVVAGQSLLVHKSLIR